MANSALVRLMVPVTEKLIVSPSAEAAIVSRNEPAPLSLRLVTVRFVANTGQADNKNHAVQTRPHHVSRFLTASRLSLSPNKLWGKSKIRRSKRQRTEDPPSLKLWRGKQRTDNNGQRSDVRCQKSESETLNSSGG